MLPIYKYARVGEMSLGRILKKKQKTFQNPLDKRGNGWYTTKASRWRSGRGGLAYKEIKKPKKVLKKYLTNGERSGIIEKLSGTGDGSGGHRSLKIGQQNFEH